MNLLIETLTTLGIISCSFLGDIPASEVPSIVKNAFKAEFPAAKDIEWELENENYEVEFEIDNTDYAAYFSKTGTMLMQKQETTTNELPAALKEVLEKDFNSYEIDDVEKLEKEGLTYYQVELEGKVDKKEVFTSEGQRAVALDYWD